MTSPAEATTATAAPPRWRHKLARRPGAGFAVGGVVGLLSGMIGLGGAEFRLPLLIGLFGFLALQAVILNKAMSLAVVITALPARLVAVPASELAAYWLVAANLLAGSLIGAWVGASWATRMRSTTLHKVLAGLLVLMAAALVITHVGGPATASTCTDQSRPSPGSQSGSASELSPPSWASPVGNY
jgi:uncharacterized membrane protein YfcA